MRVALLIQRARHTVAANLRHQAEVEAAIVALARPHDTWVVDLATETGRRLARALHSRAAVEELDSRGEGKGAGARHRWGAQVLREADRSVVVLFEPSEAPERQWIRSYRDAGTMLLLMTWRVPEIPGGAAGPWGVAIPP